MFNQPAFDAMSKQLQEWGYDVFNPTRNGISTEAPWEEHLKLDIREVTRADFVVVFGKWFLSKGSYLEVTIARQLSIPVLRFDGLTFFVEDGPALDEIAQMPFINWWRAMTEHEIKLTAPKMASYGSRGEDLLAIGRSMAQIGKMVTPAGITDDQFHGELGIHFYTTGKVARFAEAFRNGELPSFDSYFDIGVYTKMAEKFRLSGYWG
jgi:hypothetical protein